MEFVNLIVLFIILIYIKINRAQIIGNKGEKRVNKKLETMDGYRTLKDILLKTEKGTTQIDHILIGPKGIFIIETKNYDGWIFGDERSQYWTQVVYKQKNKFFNPIRQNYGHVMAVKGILDEKFNESISSLVVFSNRSQFKNIKVTSSVIHERNLKGYIRGYLPKRNLSEDEINRVCGIISSKNIEGKEARKIHKKKLSSKYGR